MNILREIFSWTVWILLMPFALVCGLLTWMTRKGWI
jgi:hypothetical protein